LTVASRTAWPWRPGHGALLLALAAGAGIVDALSYLGLGRVFTANMTGNTVLLGVAAATGHVADAARAGVALGGFCLGVAAGVAFTRHGRPWPQAARHMLWLEAAALALLLALWALVGVAPARYVLIAAAGVAMGAQSAAVRACDVRGVNTTFMTSTLMNGIARVILRLRGISESGEGPSLPAAAWFVYGVAALAGALIEHAWGAVAVVPPLAIVGAIALVASRTAPA
jgi:uncharacterized membrane protein YoaK (UPF0700 family)